MLALSRAFRSSIQATRVEIHFGEQDFCLSHFFFVEGGTRDPWDPAIPFHRLAGSRRAIPRDRIAGLHPQSQGQVSCQRWPHCGSLQVAHHSLIIHGAFLINAMANLLAVCFIILNTVHQYSSTPNNVHYIITIIDYNPAEAQWPEPTSHGMNENFYIYPALTNYYK